MLTKTKVKPAVAIPSSLRPRFWIGAIALVCAIACAVALVFVALGMATGKGVVQPQSSVPQPPSTIPLQTFEGIVTDTQCGARHSAAIGKTAADCTLACVHGGGQFALVDGDVTYVLEGDLAMLKRAAGQRVKIIGTLNGTKISVTSVGAA